MGLEIHIDQRNGILTIDQTEYAKKILQKFGMLDCNPVNVPMEPSLKLLIEDGEPTQQPYRALMGSLMYLMLGTRPDLCFAVGFMSRFQDKATDTHWKHLRRVLRYVKGTDDFQLTYRRRDVAALYGYVDADWANCPNDRKSTTGYLLNVFGNTIIWSSKKQSLVTLSTTEAEFVAATSAAKEVLWLQKLLSDLRIEFDRPTVLYEDNYGCLQVSKTMETKRSKHFDIRYHFLKDLVQEKKIKLVYVDSKRQVADGLTKALPKMAFEIFVNGVCLERGGLMS